MVLTQYIAAKAPPILGACTRQTMRCPDATDYGKALRPCCRGHLRQIVKDTVAALDRCGCAYFADYGTLLGAVRNPLTTWADYYWLPQDQAPEGPLAPGILPHDKDADLGVFYPDWGKLMRVRSELQNRGYDVTVRLTRAMLKVRLSPQNHTALDLFCWTDPTGTPTRPSGMLSRVGGQRGYIHVDRYKGRDFPASWLDPISHVSWEGLSLKAPTHPAQFCEFRYGANWMKPIPMNNDGVRR